MRIYKENVQYIIDEKDLARYKKLGFKVLGVKEVEAVKTPKKKPLEKMKVDELKALAQELGIDGIDSLNKDELITVIKEAQDGKVD